MAILKNGKERKITIKNFAYVPDLTEYLFSITYALQNDFNLMDEEKTMVLYKNKTRIKFDRVVKKGLSFMMCLKIIPDKLDQVNIGTEEAKEKKAVDFMEYHERLGDPSEELTIATAKVKGIKLKKKRAKCLACAMAKAKRKAIKKVTFAPETVPGRTLHIDISLVKHKSKGGAKFWLQIADGARLKKWSFFLKKKSDQYDVIEKFLLELKVKGCETKVIDVHYRSKLKMDNAGENKKLEEILKLKVSYPKSKGIF